MREISLIELLEAGCHFGHKVTRWYPKASSFIYQAREGIHIIDLVKTRDWLKRAAEYVFDLGKQGKIFLFIASKRQAKGVASEAAKRADLPYMTNRWIGGFLTNWDEVKKNIERMNTWRKEKSSGGWDKYPKHEIVKLDKLLRKTELIYAGVADLSNLPDAVFIVDINKEDTALKEATRREIPIVAMVDTNSNPTLAEYPIPANDDAVGSIQYIVNFIADAYIEGKKMGQKVEIKNEKKPSSAPADAKAMAGKEEKKKEEKQKKEVEKKVRKVHKDKK